MPQNEPAYVGMKEGRGPEGVLDQWRSTSCWYLALSQPGLVHRVIEDRRKEVADPALLSAGLKLPSVVLSRLPWGLVVKNPPTYEEMWFQPLGQEDPLEKGMATHSSILPWEIPWTEEPGGLRSMGSQESDMT